MLRELAGLLVSPPAARSVRVALLGCFSVGKSTLISTLLGEEVAEAHALPTSRCIARFRYARTPSIRILRDGCVEQDVELRLSRDWFARWFGGERIVDALPAAAELAGADVEIGLPHPLLRTGVDLLDTPGHDALAGADRETALAGLERADAVLYLCQRRHLLSEADLPILDAVVASGRPWALVVTHLGSRGRRESFRDELRDHVRAVSGRWTAPPPVLWAPDPDAASDEDQQARRAALVACIEGWRRRFKTGVSR
jgi:hypothetical protein